MGKRTKEERQEIARQNAEAREERSPAQQLKELDRKLGADVGAKKERAELWRQVRADA